MTFSIWESTRPPFTNYVHSPFLLLLLFSFLLTFAGIVIVTNILIMKLLKRNIKKKKHYKYFYVAQLFSFLFTTYLAAAEIHHFLSRDLSFSDIPPEGWPWLIHMILVLVVYPLIGVISWSLANTLQEKWSTIKA